MGSALSPSPSPSDHRRRAKLHALIRRHEDCKAAFSDLRSHVRLGLLEAKEVFDSLSAPLMTLVGIKSEQMAREGRSSSVLVQPAGSSFEEIGGSESLGGGGPDRCRRVDEERREVKHYSMSARAELQKLQAIQQNGIHHLTTLLRAIEHHVNSHQDAFFQTLDNHRGSLHAFFKESTAFVSELPQPLQCHGTTTTVAYVAARILKAAFQHVGTALDAVEGAVESLLNDLANVMCAPMASYLKNLRAQASAGPPVQLLSVVLEMEKVLQEQREVEAELDKALRDQGKAAMELERALGAAMIEVELARKKAKFEEQEKIEASRLCHEYRDKFRHVKQFVLKGALSEKQLQMVQPNSSISCMENSQRHPPALPLAPSGENMVKRSPVKLRKLTNPRVAHRPVTRSCTSSHKLLKTPPSTIIPLAYPKSAPPPSVYGWSAMRR